MKHGAPGVGDGGDGGLTSGVLVANFAFGSFFVQNFDLTPTKFLDGIEKELLGRVS